MMKIEKRYLLWGLWVLTLGSVAHLSRSALVLAQDQQVRVIELTAKRFEYSPSPVHVKSGTKIQLKITATDHDHGFKIASGPDGSLSGTKSGLIFTSPQDCWELKKGQTTIVEFLAQTPGTYSFKCCHLCGLGHRGMKSQIVVD